MASIASANLWDLYLGGAAFCDAAQRSPDRTASLLRIDSVFTFGAGRYWKMACFRSG